ncbi:hypothetical protein P152DRAFT_453167 [Eremomyces bilateralis CBS 781.70]|uniref:Alpha/beta-hydrolase n=1 Tax=Eremomyces bilateralis CBS 781.70 TaxID=1392243 RepID=A0A6G1FQN8_9PEZI|nr:uncharacterized protein P152DRAFT_453167 [Eremomyces bilateralis CBS 781.70]KAF1808104.1 hypothetical protein P152DRAFT_453167 [Eremomyces bilateralis CBS 781.70]
MDIYYRRQLTAGAETSAPRVRAYDKIETYARFSFALFPYGIPSYSGTLEQILATELILPFFTWSIPVKLQSVALLSLLAAASEATLSLVGVVVDWAALVADYSGEGPLEDLAEALEDWADQAEASEDFLVGLFGGGGGIGGALGGPSTGGSGPYTAFITQNAGKGKYANVDASKIAAAGQSCGSLEAYDVAPDPRVSAVGIFNSGAFSDSASQQAVAKLHQPVFYFLGGSSDIAFENGERDFKNLPSNIPSWKGNLPVGHMATWADKDGGKFGVAGTNWLMWLLKDDQGAARCLTGGGAQQEGWDVAVKNLQSI